MVSIAISFLIMIIAIAVSSGFRHEIRRGISLVSGDVQISLRGQTLVNEEEPLRRDLPGMDAVETLPGVEKVVPAVYRAGIVRSGENIHGVLFKGVPGGGDSLRVSIPSRLADLVGLQAGDDMLTYFVGDKVRVRKFKVASVYPNVLGSAENLVVIAGLEDMQRLNGWSEKEVSALEVILSDTSDGNAVMEEKAQDIGTILLFSASEEEEAALATSALKKYPQLFSWLDLIDTNVLFILILMTIVAGFNMISGLLILLLRNISTIGILKSMGMRDRSISEVFLRVASTLVLQGMLIGNGLALAFCLIQGKTHLIRLNPEHYFLSYVPVHLDPLMLLGVNLAAYLLIMILLLIPSLYVSKVDPAITVRAQ